MQSNKNVLALQEQGIDGILYVVVETLHIEGFFQANKTGISDVATVEEGKSTTIVRNEWLLKTGGFLQI